ncbi:MAG: LptF/LptG family permease [Phycisphaerae bacterium]|nr:LptF/LptG family permease [Phycisphaerae bacterium]
MMRRPPRILWLHTLAALWRLLALTTAVLVTVLAFAASIRPVAGGELSPVDALRFIALALIPMSAYALPFACAFASTLTYHRLATDLELTAAQASGISLRALLVPAAITGLLVSGSLAVLNEAVIPRYLRGMQEVVKADFARLITNAIQRGRSVELNDLIVAADSAQALTPDPASGAVDHVVLLKMVAVRVDKQGRVKDEISATRADVWMFPEVRADGTLSGRRRGDGDMALVLRVDDAVGLDQGSNLVLTSGQEWAVMMPSTLKDDPKFLTFGELRRLGDDPDQMNWIDARRRELALALGRLAAPRELRRRLDATGSITLTDGAGNRVVVRASGLAQLDPATPDDWTLIPSAPGGAIEVDLHRPGSPRAGATTAWSARSARLVPRISTDTVRRDLAFQLELDDASARAVGGAASPVGAQGRVVRAGLTPQPDPMIDLLAEPSLALALRARADAEASGAGSPLRKAHDSLVKEIRALDREVLSKQHERMALAASCFVMVLTGGVTAVRLSRSQPLTVYLWTFFPALLAIITIAGGQNMTHASGPIGLALLWSGVLALAAYTLAVYSILARH